MSDLWAPTAARPRGALGAADAAARHLRVPTLVLLGTICFVPVWAGLTFRAYFPPATLAALVVVVAGLGGRRLRLTAVDLVVLLLGTVVLLAALAGASGSTPLFTAFLVWGVAYGAGRVVGENVPAPWLAAAVALAFGLAATLAIVESATGSNVFKGIVAHNQLYTGWSPLQLRGGRIRAEGAFGHGIALGTCLASAVPFVLAAPLRLGVRMVTLVLVLTAIALTFSRAAMICALLGLVLVLLRTDFVSARARWALAGVSAFAVAVLLSTVLGTLGAAGAEASDSAAYRSSLLDLVRSIAPLGLSDARAAGPTGPSRFGPFRSIDDALLLSGLTYGWLFLLPVLFLLLAAAVTVLRGRSSAPLVAVAAQLPALVTVALITQYASWLWFLAGLAASAPLRSSRAALLPRAAPDPDHPFEREAPP